MDQDKDKNIEFTNKLKLFFIKQKIKIILIFFAFYSYINNFFMDEDYSRKKKIFQFQKNL